MNGRLLAVYWVIALLLALVIYPSGCHSTTAPPECKEVRVEGHKGHTRPHNDTIYVGGCPRGEDE